MPAGSYVAAIVLAATVKLLANLHIVGDACGKPMHLVWNAKIGRWQWMHDSLLSPADIERHRVYNAQGRWSGLASYAEESEAGVLLGMA